MERLVLGLLIAIVLFFALVGGATTVSWLRLWYWRRRNARILDEKKAGPSWR